MWETLSKLNLGGLSHSLRPSKEFARLFEQAEAPRMRLLQIFLAGIILVQWYADLFDMGDSYEVGKVMSLSLILGPVAGLLLAVFGALFMVNMGCLLDTGHVSKYRPRTFRPPLPLSFLVRRIMGRKNLRAAMENGWLSGYARVWNGALNWISKGVHRIAFGKTPFTRLFVATIRCSAPLVIAGIVQLLEHIFTDATSFSASVGSPLPLLLKSLLVAWSFALWVPLLRTAFQLSWVKALIGAVVSILLSTGLVLLILQAIFAVPLQ